MNVVFVPVTVTSPALQPQAVLGGQPTSVPQHIFNDPIAQLAALDPLAALAALSPIAALAALSPVLRMFNPAVNPRAALLAFQPASAGALAVSPDKQSPPWAWLR